MFAVVTVVTPVPVVVVVASTVIAVPIPREVAPAFVVRSHPRSRRIRRPRPVSRVPLIMIPFRIPVAAHPDELGAGPRRQNPHLTVRRRRTDLDADGNLRNSGCRDKDEREQ